MTHPFPVCLSLVRWNPKELYLRALLASWQVDDQSFTTDSTHGPEEMAVKQRLDQERSWSTLSRKQRCTSCCGQHVWITIKGDTKRSLPGQHAQRSDIQRAHQHGQSHTRSLSLDHLFGCLVHNCPLLVAVFKQLVCPVTATPQITWYLVTNMDRFLYHQL